MTEPAAGAQYGVSAQTANASTQPEDPGRWSPAEQPDWLMVYFMRRRDVLIAELREIDRLLGRPQTIPQRKP